MSRTSPDPHHQVCMRSLGFDVKKAEVIQLMEQHDPARCAASLALTSTPAPLLQTDQRFTALHAPGTGASGTASSSRS